MKWELCPAGPRKYFLPLRWFCNLYSGRHVLEPLTQADEYPLDELVALLHHLGAKSLYIQPESNDNRNHWAFVFCAKDSA